MNDETLRVRPTGVTLLAILNLLSGAAIVLMMLFQGGGLNEIDDDLRTIGASAALVRLSAFILGLLFVGTGVALWSGRTKGWWFATWVVGMMSVKTLLAALTVGEIAAQMGASPAEVAPHRVKFLIRGVLYLAILAYLFKPNVLHFFGVGTQPRGKTFLKLGGAVVVGIVVWSGVGLLAGS